MSVERVERALTRLGTDPWNTFLHVDAARARARARRAEGPLTGLVASVKDNLALTGMPMTCGSRHLAGYVAPYTATVVARLEAAGAVVLGKTNMDEFAAGSSGETSAFGPTRNPHDPGRVPGGSSSGAGASVASGVCDVALGSDTGGSIRCPAAFCGAVGFKPGRGMLSRHGLADLAMSLETPAPLTRNVEALARVMDVLAGPDPRDVQTRAVDPGAFRVALADAHPEGLRIGMPPAFFEGVSPEVERPVRAALARLESRGAHLVEVQVPNLRHALSSYYVLNYAEFASAMQRYDGVRYGTPGPEGADASGCAQAARATFGAEVKRRILLGTYVTSQEGRASWYDVAARAREELARRFAQALSQVDVLMGPTMPVRAFRLGERMEDPQAMYAVDVLTVSANLARLPAGSVPLAVEGLPVGLQVMGAPGTDARVVAAMGCVEAAAGVAA